MDTIRGIVRNIAVVILLASFLELLLPNNSMRRFVQLVMGLFVLMAILGPVTKLLNLPLAFEVPAWSSTPRDNQDLVQAFQQGKQIQEQGQQAALEEYTKILTQQVKALALTVKGVDKANIKVNTKQTGEIGQVEVDVGQSQSKIPPIKPINGSNELASAPKSLTAEEQRIAKELKSRLAALLGLTEDKIVVNFGK